MGSVIVITNKEWSATRFAEIAKLRWEISGLDEHHCVVGNGQMHVIINADQTINNDYDDEEIAAVLEMVPEPKFFIFEFNDFEFGKEVLEELADASDIAVDDDHGNILIGTEFCSRIRNNVSYDWR